MSSKPTPEQLIAQLNEWEARYGTTYPPNAGLADTGESGSRITELKRRLIGLGAVFHWDGSQYVLDRVERPGHGLQGPDILPPRSPGDEFSGEP